MTKKANQKRSDGGKEDKLGEILVAGFRVLISGICALILIVLWVLAFALYDKGHFAGSVLTAILAAIIIKKGIIDIILGKTSSTDKYSLGYQ